MRSEKLALNHSPSWSRSSIVLIIYGIALICMGFYFLVLRPAFLPEDLRFIGIPLDQSPAAEIDYGPWLHRVFRVMGGYIIGVGVLNITLAATAFRAHHRRAAAGVFVSGLFSIVLMTTINFQIDSDFKWVLFSITLFWITSLALFLFETRQNSNLLEKV